MLLGVPLTMLLFVCVSPFLSFISSLLQDILFNYGRKDGSTFICGAFTPALLYLNGVVALLYDLLFWVLLLVYMVLFDSVNPVSGYSSRSMERPIVRKRVDVRSFNCGKSSVKSI